MSSLLISPPFNKDSSLVHYVRIHCRANFNGGIADLFSCFGLRFFVFV